jgi:hypothetical protein
VWREDEARQIFCVGGVDPGLVSGLPGEPPEERFERAQGRRDRRRAQLLAGPGVRLLGQTGFERLGLLDVEVVEIAESGVAFEAMQRGRDRLKRRLAPAHRLPQEINICALDPLVRGLGLRHGVLSLSGVTIEEGFRRLVYWLKRSQLRDGKRRIRLLS